MSSPPIIAAPVSLAPLIVIVTTLGDFGYGDFEITSNVWTFTLNNAHAAVQALDVTETLNDTFTFTASDGSTQVVTITINGAEDAAVIGGGDRLIFLASYAHDKWARQTAARWFKSVNPTCPRCGHQDVADRWHAGYSNWARRWSQAVQGKVGYANTLIRDFYHGTHASRLYGNRTQVLLRQNFDPEEDLRLNSDGGYEWRSHKPKLHEDLRTYIFLRTDG